MNPAPQAPNRHTTGQPNVKVANTVTLQKDGQGQATLDELRHFVDAAKDFNGDAKVKIEAWDDQRDGMHVKISVTEGV